MKNEIAYFYHLYPTKLIKKEKKYYFEYLGKNYTLCPYTRNLIEQEDLYLLNVTLTQKNLFFPKMIKNIKGETLTFINGKYYVLKQETLSEEVITFEQVKYQFPYLLPLYQLKNIARNNWPLLWEKKIDYFEYQREHIYQKFPKLVEYLDYFIGLAENAIAYIKEIEQQIPKKETDRLTFTRRRIHAQDKLPQFYDPICFVIDHKARDLSEFIKSSFFEMDISQKQILYWIEELQLSNYGWGLFFGRMLFPTFFFDLYEEIVNENAEENRMDEILDRMDDYQELLAAIQVKIRNKNHLPEIQWIHRIKKEGLH